MIDVNRALMEAEALIASVNPQRPSPVQSVVPELISQEVRKTLGSVLIPGPPGVPGRDGRSITLEDVWPVIKKEIEKVRPRDGKDGKDGRDGKDGKTGKNIERIVRSLEEDAAKIQFNPDIAGSVLVNVRDALRPYVSVRWFGAVGDGSDETTKIQAALNTGEDVYFPPPQTQYKITSALVLKASNQRIYGEGSACVIRQFTTDANVIEAVSKTGIVIENLNIYAAGTSSSISTGNGIYLDTCTRAAVRHCTVQGYIGAGVNLRNTNDSVVEFNFFTNAPTPSAGYDDTDVGEDIRISHSSNRNKVAGNTINSGAGVGIIVQSVETGDECNDNVVIGNTVTNARIYGIAVYRNDDVAPITEEVFRTIVSGNTINGVSGEALNSVTGTYTYGAGIYIQGAEYSIVSGNNITDTHSAAVTFAESLAPGAIGVNNVGNCIVTGNFISNAGMLGIDITDANNLGDDTGSVISGNVIKDCADSGIRARTIGALNITNNILDTTGSNAIEINLNTTTTVDNYVISGNKINNVTGTGVNLNYVDGANIFGNSIDTTSVHGIAASNCANVSITDNTIKDHTTRGIQIASTTSNSRVFDNTIVGTGTSTEGLRLDTATDYGGNKISGCTTFITASFQPYQTLSVRNYGVKGDGATDDTAAIERAVTEAGTDAVLVFDAGMDCLVSSEVDLTVAGQKIIGYGAKITKDASFTGAGILRASAANITIEGLEIDGTDQADDGIFTDTDADGLTVRNCEIYDCNYGIAPRNVQNVLVEGNYVHDVAAYCVLAQNIADTRALTNIRIINNRLDQTTQTAGSSTALCVLVRGTSTRTTTDVVVSGNRMIHVENPTNSSALCCEFRYVNGGVFSENFGKDGAMLVSVVNSQNVTVTGNVGDGNTFYAVEVVGNTTDPCKNIVVSSNTIEGRDRMNYGVGIQGTGTNLGVSVLGNTIKDTTLYGVYVNSTWTDIAISSNRIDMDAGNYGIYLDGVTETALVSGNVLDGNGAALKGVYLKDVSNVSVTGNAINDWTENGVLVHCTTASDEISISGNQFIGPGIGKTVSGTLGSQVSGVGNSGANPSGTTGADIINFADNVYRAWGTNTPEGSFTAGVGSTFTRLNGGNNNIFYVKVSGTGNTGWLPVPTPTVSADNGNAAATLTVGTDELTQVWNTALTADRAVTLSTTGAWNGAKFRVVRTTSATGAFNLNVGTGPLVALKPGEWCDVEYNGSAWALSAYSSLSPDDHAYAVQSSGALFSPTDALTYYQGIAAAVPSTTEGLTRLRFPVAGTIIAAQIDVGVAGTLGTTEQATMSFRLNATTDTTLSSVVQFNASNQGYLVTGLSIAVATTDTAQIKTVMPTFSTNPTNVAIGVTLYVRT